MVRDFIEVLPPNECQTCVGLKGVVFATMTIPIGVSVSESFLCVCQTCKSEFRISAVSDKWSDESFKRLRFKVSRKENEQ